MKLLLLRVNAQARWEWASRHCCAVRGYTVPLSPQNLYRKTFVCLVLVWMDGKVAAGSYACSKQS
jgi:hypothetical protein